MMKTKDEIKTFDEQRYPCEIAVIVIEEDGTRFFDGIKGLNAGHALWRAYWNWPGVQRIVQL